MSSLGLVFSIARDALSAQRYGMDVTAHNIANVNTEGYSRQRAVHNAKEPAPYGGVLLGRGVDTEEVVRLSDQFVENRLIQQGSGMVCFTEMESHMQVLEGLFSENSEMSISALMANFWNMWHDVTNNPSGASERIALYEHSVLLSGQFNALYTDLTQFEIDITNAVSAGIGEINQITAEIAQINGEIVGLEADKIANDLRDKRNTLVSELCEYLDAKTFQQPNGSLTVVTARGCVLVDGNESYDLTLGGSDGKRVEWQGSGGNSVDITDYLNDGKLGGWLDMRDEVIAKCKLDLDALAKEVIWTINQQHSQGVGLKLFQPNSSLSGTYTTTTDLGDLPHGEDAATGGYVDYNGTFDLWIGDAIGENLNGVTIDLTYTNPPVVPFAITDASTLAELAASINDQIAAAGLAGVTASVSDNAIAFTAVPTHTFGFSDDTSGILGALGINTFFTGSSAGGMGVNDVIGSDKDYIASAQIDSSGNYATGDNTNALAITDLQYTSIDIAQWTCDRRNGNTQTAVNATIEEYYHGMVGSIGIKSASISRERAFNEAMFSKLGEIRDGISAVSLDEEMTNLMKYQHAYSAAAKLISVSDEMLNALLSVK
jgi:flagellar hook-associated protein 1 FlgK